MVYGALVHLVAGRYEIVAPLGVGGFATVYQARDQRLQTEVALKLIPAGDDAESALGRLSATAPLLSRVQSRFIAQMLDFGRDETNGVYVVTELIDGVPLSVEGLGRTLSAQEILRLARALFEGLAAAHALGTAHGDIKPTNVLVPRSSPSLDVIKITDFGVAQRHARHEIDVMMGHPKSTGPAVFGTPAFMAPEQLVGGELGPHTDVFAAALVLFGLLGLGDPFVHAVGRDQLRARVLGSPDLLHRAADPLPALLGPMLAREPDQRLADAQAALIALAELSSPRADLSSYLDDDSPTSVRARPASLVPSQLPLLGTLAPPTKSMPPFTSAMALTGVPAPLPTSDALDTGPAGALSGPPSSAAPMALSARPSRLVALPQDASTALFDVLSALDLPMLDALARRERGNTTGRIARAVSLALRLELDAAALILEPLLGASPVARAAAVSLVAPLGKRTTRARIDTDLEDRWTDAVEPQLGALFTALSVVITPADGTSRLEERLLRAHRRINDLDANSESRLSRTLGLAELCVQTRQRPVLARTGVAEANALAESDGRGGSALERYLRSMYLADISFPLEDAVSAAEHGAAIRVAQDAGATLLELAATVLPDATHTPVFVGAPALERAAFLVAHADAPHAELRAEWLRGIAGLFVGHYELAQERFGRALAVAQAERAFDLEAGPSAWLAIAELAAARGARGSERLRHAALLRPNGATSAAMVAFAVAIGFGTQGDLPALSAELVKASQVTLGSARLFRDGVHFLRVCVAGVREGLGAVESAAQEMLARVHRGEPLVYEWADVLVAALEGAPLPLRQSAATLLAALDPLRLKARETGAPPS
jgi:eukaryotic-like serine/threonine-protein kinase